MSIWVKPTSPFSSYVASMWPFVICNNSYVQARTPPIWRPSQRTHLNNNLCGRGMFPLCSCHHPDVQCAWFPCFHPFELAWVDFQTDFEMFLLLSGFLCHFDARKAYRSQWGSSHKSNSVGVHITFREWDVSRGEVVIFCPSPSTLTSTLPTFFSHDTSKGRVFKFNYNVQ